jgi:hypothetical protein
MFFFIIMYRTCWTSNLDDVTSFSENINWRKPIFSRSIFAILSWYIVFFHGTTAPSGPGPPHYRGFTITIRHTTFGRTSLDKWSASSRDLYMTTHNTRHTQENINTTGGILTHNPSKRTATDPRLRPSGHWNRRFISLISSILHVFVKVSKFSCV